MIFEVPGLDEEAHREREEGSGLNPKSSHIKRQSGGCKRIEKEQPRRWRETRPYIVMATKEEAV